MSRLFQTEIVLRLYSEQQLSAADAGRLLGLIRIQFLDLLRRDSSPLIYAEAKLRGWVSCIEDKLDALRAAGFRLSERDYRLIIEKIGGGKTGR